MPDKVQSLPVHSQSSIDTPVVVRRIEHKNPYDFTREHRHTYYEIFFFETGGGNQLIDFNNLPVKEQSSYIVCPQQIHLLKRAPKAKGRLVQFGDEVITSLHLRSLLQQNFLSPEPSVFFEKSRKTFTKLTPLLDMLENSLSEISSVTREVPIHLLQTLLFQLLDQKHVEEQPASTGDRKLLFRFQQALEVQFCTNHQVSKYAAELGTTEKKLSLITKQFLGLSPLQVIHNRLLLEAKRLLLFEDTSHKEIAFQLGFDSPASFSLFVKNKAGITPSELNLQLVQIHK